MFTARGIRLAVLIISFATIIIGISLVAVWLRFLHTPIVTQDQGIRYYLRVGTSAAGFVSDLTNKKLTRHPKLFILLIRLRADFSAMKAGEYLLPNGTTPSHMLDQMVTGSGMVHHSFTIVPGWSFHQLREALSKDEALLHTIKELSDKEIMQKLGFANLHPEGQFYPDTYYFFAESTDLALLKRAFRNMQAKLTGSWIKRSANLPFKTAYEALIAASIIEKEARLNEERPLIAGVMVNRLKKNMLLQFDPTVIYGLGMQYDGKIYKQDLLTSTPYNTYIHKGLPPTPISMPSLKSLEAVMHPAQHNYLYFVGIGDHQRHQFSHSWKEHLAAVSAAKKYRPNYYNSDLVKEYLLNAMHTTIYKLSMNICQSTQLEYINPGNIQPNLVVKKVWFSQLCGLAQNSAKLNVHLKLLC